MSSDAQGSQPGVPDERGTVEVDQPFAECWVLTPRGEIDAYSAPLLRERIVQALEADAVTRLVVDLSGTTFLDSSALGVLVGALKRVRERDGRLDVVSPPHGVRRVFEITNLDRVLELHDSLESALQR